LKTAILRNTISYRSDHINNLESEYICCLAFPTAADKGSNKLKVSNVKKYSLISNLIQKKILHKLTHDYCY